MWRIRIELAERPLHLLQLGHQIRFGVLATSGIAEQKVDLILQSALVGVITKRGRIGTVLAADHFNPESLGPNVKLLDRGGAKSIGCS